MQQHNLTPNNLQLIKGKDTKKVKQLEATEQAFFNDPCTMLMAAQHTGIERANICRYVATLRKQNKVAVIKRAYCQITQHTAGYYTTDPAKFPPISQQLNLFGQ
jgi:dethiobiotin synthetase